MSVISALADGCQRVLRAPVLVIGLWAAYVLVPSPVALVRIDSYVALVDAGAMDAAPALVSLLWSSSAAVAHAALVTFLLGGFMDRLARNRPTATFGFFGACGMFAFRFARLGLIAVPIYMGLFRWVHPMLPTDHLASTIALGLLVVAVHVLFDYAKVRMVVEDRRSAIGALLASTRFITRNPGAALTLAIVNGSIAAGTWWLAATFTIGPSAAVYAYLLARALLRLIFAASQIALFQSRLAHAGYTARPQASWPESPAAEAVRPS
ncbi:MAG TPA: hypothetical protein VMO26_03890 [Vicinamibacterales bacterium]|nr:hypothetical protein [Vicinamibacterales bacterium]